MSGPVPTASLSLDGELTIRTAAELKARLLTALDPTDRLEIGLAEVNELDTAGLQILLLVAREARQSGKDLRFVGHSRSVLDVLAIAQLTPDLDDARQTGGTSDVRETDLEELPR